MDFTDPIIQEQLKEKFSEKEMLVIFTKKSNGENRVMRCTRNPAKIPKENTETNKKPRTIPSTILVVYDLDKNSWRSFRWDSVKEIKEI